MTIWDRIAAQIVGGTLDSVGTVSHVRNWHHAHDAHGTAHVLPDFGPKHTLELDCFCHPVNAGEDRVHLILDVVAPAYRGFRF